MPCNGVWLHAPCRALRARRPRCDTASAGALLSLLPLPSVACSNPRRVPPSPAPGLTRCGTQELEGACEGTLACSTCHCIFTKELYAKLPPPDEEELDMLDLAAGLTDT